MFRPIRRKTKIISDEAAYQLLKTQRRGVLAVNGDDGYPYAIPVNFVYDQAENKIFFHGAKAGHKVDSLKKSDKVCFTVYGNEFIKSQDEAWAPCLQSAVVFGRCTLIEDREESLKRLQELAEKYYPTQELIDEEIKLSGRNAQTFEISIEHISGKQIQEK